MRCCARSPARTTGISRSWWPTTARPPATAALIDAWKGKVGRRLDHVWHEDRGFRAAEIRNRAILAARGAYCIFLDGDCIARPDFVATHRRLAEPGWFVTGNRILLSRDLTADVLRDKLTPETWSFGRWLAERRRGGINRLSALLHLPLGPLRRLRQRRLARRALLQSGDLARRSRSRRRLRRRLQRLGQGGFRHHRAPAACRRAAQGRHVRHRRAASVARRKPTARSWRRTNASFPISSPSDHIRAQRGLSAIQSAPSPALAG